VCADRYGDREERRHDLGADDRSIPLVVRMGDERHTGRKEFRYFER
jgi:hypothetical protein